MDVREVAAKSIMNRSGIPGIDFVVNPYTGCRFACKYCYASFMGRFVGKTVADWGEYVYAKVNAAELLRLELPKKLKNKGDGKEIFFSSVTDPYQGMEVKYRLTRRCLEELLAFGFKGLVSILTKSDLVLRDIDLFKKLPRVSIGLTVTSTDDGVSRFFETYAPPAKRRIAALMNAAKVAKKDMRSLRVVISGAGAAGTAIAQLLLCVGHDPNVCEPVREIIVCDSKGILSKKRTDIGENPWKRRLAAITNRNDVEGSLKEALCDADVFIGVSTGGVLHPEWIKQMREKPIVFAMANPHPEIMPDAGKEAGAFIMGTGRSDFPNQVNNVLAFPGVFLGALQARAKTITNSMKIGAALALASTVKHPTVYNILPSPLDKRVATIIAKAVCNIWREEYKL